MHVVMAGEHLLEPKDELAAGEPAFQLELSACVDEAGRRENQADRGCDLP
jgi:hypothetical protein